MREGDGRAEVEVRLRDAVAQARGELRAEEVDGLGAGLDALGDAQGGDEEVGGQEEGEAAPLACAFG